MKIIPGGPRRTSTNWTYLNNVRNFDLYNWATGLNTRSDMMLFISDQTPDIANFQEFYTQDKGDYNNVGTLRIKSGFDYQNVYINKQLK